MAADLAALGVDVVVEIENANECAVDQDRIRRAGLDRGAEHRALRQPAQVLERVEHGLRGFFGEGRKAAADRVEQQQLGLTDGRGRNVLRALRVDPIGELLDCAWSLRLDGFCHGFLPAGFNFVETYSFEPMTYRRARCVPSPLWG